MQDFLNPWSETLVFIGAGATASLGMPQTDTQSKFFRKLAVSENRLPLPKIFLGFAEKDLLQMENFLAILGDGKCLGDDRFSVSESEFAAAKKAFRLPASDSIYRNRIRELRDEYDWIGLFFANAWYRLSECSAPGAPVGRIGKFLFAHGCSLWRECPVCGRIVLPG